MKRNILIFVIFSTLVTLSACGGAEATPEPTPIPPPPPEPTALPPTVPPEPTIEPSPIPIPTSTPENQVFRDDFTGELQPGWIWENENPEKWTLTDDGWLEIIGEVDSLLGESQQNNLLWYPLPEGDFVITAHLKANPSENFHQATIYIYEGPENYIAINRGYCDICPPEGNGFFMEYKIGGDWGAYSAATDAEDVYLRLENKDNVLSGYYAVKPDQWERIGRFGNYFQFKKVGIGVTNVRAENDVVGLFDYFEITKP